MCTILLYVVAPFPRKKIHVENVGVKQYVITHREQQQEKEFKKQIKVALLQGNLHFLQGMSADSTVVFSNYLRFSIPLLSLRNINTRSEIKMLPSVVSSQNRKGNNLKNSDPSKSKRDFDKAL